MIALTALNDMAYSGVHSKKMTIGRKYRKGVHIILPILIMSAMQNMLGTSSLFL